jgi:hypothetical protein
VFVLSKLGRLSIAALVVAGVALPAAPVAAAKDICVALVVDARSLDGPLSTKCTTVPDGSTGYDVLRAAGHTVGFRHDGLICTIDNRPSDGCAATDAVHFWAYFHREPHASSWSYSNEGATTYKPENGETEGWVWRDGDMAKPANVPYPTICPQTVSPSPSMSSTAKASTPKASAAAATSPSPSTLAQPTSSRHRHRQRRAVTSPSPAPSTSAVQTTRTIATANTDRDAGSSGPPWGVIVGAVFVIGLGGAAAMRWRRRGVDQP